MHNSPREMNMSIRGISGGSGYFSEYSNQNNVNTLSSHNNFHFSQQVILLLVSLFLSIYPILIKLESAINT
jgi:hypothetical protein